MKKHAIMAIFYKLKFEIINQLLPAPPLLLIHDGQNVFKNLN